MGWWNQKTDIPMRNIGLVIGAVLVGHFLYALHALRFVAVLTGWLEVIKRVAEISWEDYLVLSYIVGLYWAAEKERCEIKKAEEGDAEAKYQLAQSYMTEGNKQEYALKWFRRAAEEGHAAAQFVIGSLYLEGFRGDNNTEFLKQDYQEALKWFLKAAEQGESEAQYHLGEMYAMGKGVEKDETQAIEWYFKAAKQGNKEARRALASHGKKLENMQRNVVEDLRLAAERGEPEAQYKLGILYDTGDGVEQDKWEAVEWWRKAAKQGDKNARNELANRGIYE